MKKKLLIIMALAASTLAISVYAGRGWEEVHTPWLGRISSIAEIEFIDPEAGWAVGDNSDNGSAFVLNFKNGNWHIASSFRTRWNALHLVALDVISASSAWAVGHEYTVWKDKSRGFVAQMVNGKWRKARFPKISHNWVLNDVAFASADKGWIVGEDRGKLTGRIYAYRSGKWIRETLVGMGGIRFDLRAVDVSIKDGSEAWAVGATILPMEEDNPLIALHYKNGVWKNSPFPKPKTSEMQSLKCVSFPARDEGWAGGKGTFAHYIKGKWTLLIPPEVSEIWTINSINFHSKSEGWITGFDQGKAKAFVLQYKDGKWYSASAGWTKKVTESNSVFRVVNGDVWLGGSIKVGTGSPAALFRLRVR